MKTDKMQTFPTQRNTSNPTTKFDLKKKKKKKNIYIYIYICHKLICIFTKVLNI